MIKGKRSASAAGSQLYQQSARFFRRQNRKHGAAITVPSVLGPNTAVIAALAHGPLRRANLQMRFQERILQSARKLDAAGLTTSWQLPNLKPGKGVTIGKGRARRGICVAINPAFPLANDVQRLARRIAETYDIAIADDLHPGEAEPVPAHEPIDMYRLCGSAVKTKTLLTLECLRGRTRSHTLFHGVPDEPLSGVKGMVRSLVALGIVTNVDGEVRFAATPWRNELRKLLRAFLDREPAFGVVVRKQAAQKKQRTKGYQRYGLFGKNAALRLLCNLAASGPLARSKLEARASLGTSWHLYERFANMGILTRAGSQRRSRYALNAAHPLYTPLVRYFLELQGLEKPAATDEVRTPNPSFSAERLFGTQLQLDVLVMLYLADDDGIDGADLRRLLPQHNQRNMREKLWDFCAWDVAVEDEMDFGMIRYRLNKAFPQYRALTAILAAVVKMYPNYQRAYALREYLWPEYRASREQNRSKRPQSQTRPI